MRDDPARRGRLTALVGRGMLAVAILGAAGLATGAAVLAPVGPSVGETVGGTSRGAVAASILPATTLPIGPAPTVPPTTGGGPSRPQAAPADPDGLRAADPALRAAAERFLADPSVVGHVAGISAWVEGRGEILAVGATRELQPASVQKVATAFAVLERLEPARRFRTVVTATGPVGPDGSVRGDLVLVGGGDPTLGRSGPHSLDSLAAQVAAAGVTRVEGRVVVDATRWSPEPAAPGWLDWHQPRHIGWLSALIADGNRWQQAGDAADPAGANGRWFAQALGRNGVAPGGEVRVVSTPPAAATTTELASTTSVPRDELVRRMLLTSDNLIAEAFVRELGRAGDGPGTHERGAAVVTEVLGHLLGRPPGGQVADGSGLSRADHRSTGEWQALLRAARGRPWWPTVEHSLPLAGATGTLATRFGATPAAGNVRAKTGTTIEARALAGVFTTPTGQAGVFAIVVNGPPTDGPVGAEQAIDRLVVDLVSAS